MPAAILIRRQHTSGERGEAAEQAPVGRQPADDLLEDVPRPPARRDHRDGVVGCEVAGDLEPRDRVALHEHSPAAVFVSPGVVKRVPRPAVHAASAVSPGMAGKRGRPNRPLATITPANCSSRWTPALGPAHAPGPSRRPYRSPEHSRTGEHAVQGRRSGRRTRADSPGPPRPQGEHRHGRSQGGKSEKAVVVRLVFVRMPGQTALWAASGSSTDRRFGPLCSSTIGSSPSSSRCLAAVSPAGPAPITATGPGPTAPVRLLIVTPLRCG